MWQLFQFPLCPFSRKVRLILAEKGVGHELVRENPWERRDEFIDLNPAGETPVMAHLSFNSRMHAIGRVHMPRLLQQVARRLVTRSESSVGLLKPPTIVSHQVIRVANSR